MPGEYLRNYLPGITPGSSALGDAITEVQRNRMMQRKIDQDRLEMEAAKATATAARESEWQNARYKKEWDNEQQQRTIRQQDVHDVRDIEAKRAEREAAARDAIDIKLAEKRMDTSSHGALAMKSQAERHGFKINLITLQPEPIEAAAPGELDALIASHPRERPEPLRFGQVQGTGNPAMDVLSHGAEWQVAKASRDREIADYDRKMVDYLANADAVQTDRTRRESEQASNVDRKAQMHEGIAGPAYTITNPEGQIATVDPIENAHMASNRQKAAGGRAPGPDAEDFERMAFEEGKKTAIELAPLIGHDKAYLAGEKLRNEMANRAASLRRAEMMPRPDHFPEGEKRRVATQEQQHIDVIIARVGKQFNTGKAQAAIAAAERGEALMASASPLQNVTAMREAIKAIHGAAVAVPEGKEFSEAGSLATRAENLLSHLEHGTFGPTYKADFIEMTRAAKLLSYKILHRAGQEGIRQGKVRGPIDVSKYTDQIYRGIAGGGESTMPTVSDDEIEKYGQ